MKPTAIILLLLSAISTSALAQDAWPSPYQYIKSTGADKIQPGKGATFHTRVETRSTHDLDNYEKLIEKGRQTRDSTTVCQLFYQEAIKLVPPGVSITLRSATSSGRTIGCVLKYISHQEEGSQIFFIEKIRTDIYQLAFRN